MLPENTILQGRYQIIQQIGRGGMGAVYKALDTRLRATVALKETLVTGDNAHRAFEREAQLLANLRHAVLPRVSDHFVDENGGQFLVMEFIPGDDLGRMLQRRDQPFNADDVLRWADRLLDALEYLHSQDPPIVHRDIKPQNMKLTDRGEVVLLDFGLAKGSVPQGAALTNSASIYGYTPHYAPLEQIQGSGTDPRSDLYGLAATLYHLLTGNTPPDALSRATARIDEEPDPLVPAHRVNDQLPEALGNVLQRAMAQSTSQRYPTAAAMRAALRTAMNDTGETSRISDQTARLAASQPGRTVVVRADDLPAAAINTTNVPTMLPVAAEPVSSGTTQTTPPPVARKRNSLLPLGIGVALAVVLGIGAALALRPPAATPPPTPTVGQPLIAAEPTAPQVPTMPPAPTIDVLLAADETRTTQAMQLATARVILGATDVAATEIAVNATATSFALTPTAPPVTAAPVTAAPTTLPGATLAAAAPTTASRPASTRVPTNTRAPTNTPPPTDTPPPAATATEAAPRGEVISSGSGRLFRGSANLSAIDPGSTGGTCIEGRVRNSDDGLFFSLGVQVDLRGNTRQPRVNLTTGTYSICGLDAGEWGVSIFQADDVDIAASEQIAHQVRVLATGTPGEVFYVNFNATDAFVGKEPTATAVVSLFDGQWGGVNNGTTAGGAIIKDGRFDIEIRNGRVYRISTDGGACPFETYPDARIQNNAFLTAGNPINPQTGVNGTIQYEIRGNFADTARASGTIRATSNGVMCVEATWSARKQ